MATKDIAQNYWLSLMGQPLFAYSAMTDLLKILERFGDDELDEANAAIQQHYADIGLAVDVDTLIQMRNTLKSSSTAFWSGLYYIPHPDGSTLKLSIGGGIVTLTSTDMRKPAYFSVPDDSASFEGQTLSYEDEKVQFSARFWFPSDLPENAAVATADMMTRNEARLTGTLSVKGDKPEGPYALTGKRGVFTAEGFSDPGYGDPAPVWAGRYQTQYVDDDFSFLGTITLSVDAEGSMAFALGDLQATAVAFRNNTVLANLPTGAVIALRLQCAASNGVRTFTGAVEAVGITRHLVGTCPVPYAASAAPRPPVRATSSAVPGFCDTHNDQVLTLAQLGTPVEPLNSLSPVPVVFADGSPGSIVITPTRAADMYRVPPGAMVAYRPPQTAGDEALQVAWQIREGYTLLTMIEPAYYQLRVTLSDAQSADRKGIDITMGLDAPSEPGFLTLLPASASTCGPDTGGARSQVKDFTFASVLLANARDIKADGTLAYRFALSGKSTSSDNAAGDHDGFLCATLTFNATDGSQKYPPRVVRVPLLCTVSLPVALAEPLAIGGMAALPGGYPNQPYSGTLSSTGGVQPIVWTSNSPAPDGLAWTASNGGSNFTLSGTLGALPPNEAISVRVSAQSDPSKVVSSVKTAWGSVTASEPPTAAHFASVPWTAGALLCGSSAWVLDAQIKWRKVSRKEQVDIEFLEDYILDMWRTLTFGEDNNRAAVFDPKQLNEMSEALRNQIRDETVHVVGPLLHEIAELRRTNMSLVETLGHITSALQSAEEKRDWQQIDYLLDKKERFLERHEDCVANLCALRAQSDAVLSTLDMS